MPNARATPEKSPFAQHWALDPAVAYLNHGSFGACPRAVLEHQAALRRELEREPVDFLVRTLPRRLREARETLAAFLGAEPSGLAFVPNATTGVNAVLRSLDFAPGDELLTTDHVYAACRKTLDYVAARSGARVVEARVPFPLSSDEEIIAPVLAAVTPRTRLALLDHVTSPTALVFPIERLVAELSARGVDTLVDGAHAPGMVPLQLSRLGAAYYTGNAHKWLCAPKGAAFLSVRRDRQAGLHPPVISHGYTGAVTPEAFQAEFDWTGTCDPTAFLCIPEALRTVGGLLPGGFPEVMATNRALALRARALLCDSLGIEAPCPEAMIGSIASVPLPAPRPGSPAARLDRDGLLAWFRERGVETWTYFAPVQVLRISAQLYNAESEFSELATLLHEALHGG